MHRYFSYRFYTHSELPYDKIILRKRSLIEAVNDQLKNVCQVELDPPSMLSELHHQSAIGFGCFLLL